MKRMKKQKKIVLILIIIIIGIGLCYVHFKNEEVAVNSSVGKLQKVILSEENCTIDLDDNKCIIQKFNGNADTAVINKDITTNGNIEINPKAFLECTNLDNILIDKEISDENLKIENFDINEDYQDDKYVEYKNTQEYSEAYQRYLETSEIQENKTGIIPDKYDVPMSALYTQSMEDEYNISTINEAEIPQSFDLRDKINIKVENQGNAGICYSFASLTAVETNLALVHNDYVDLSEVHQAALTYGYWGRFISQSDLYYSNKIGPVYESEWPMEKILSSDKDENSKILYKYFSGETITNNELNKVKKALQETKATKSVEKTVAMPSIYKSNVYTSDEIKTARKAFKTHIMKYGSLSAAIYSNAIVCKDNIYVSNTKETYDTDHLVSIIGWDDNFSKENFPISCRPENDGAYLVLNSWGADWGNDGCFWISYEDYWVENSLRGVVDVESIENNMNIDSIVVTDLDTNKETNLIATKGSRIQVKIDASINQLINNQNKFEVSIISPNGEDITSKIKTVGNDIKDNKAEILFELNTNELQVGEYTIKLKYGDEFKTVPIEINASTFDFLINDDGTIKITGYYGDEKKIEIPHNFLGYTVTSIEENAFFNNDLESITIYDNIIEIGKNIIDKNVIIYGNAGTYAEQYAIENGYTFIKKDENIIQDTGWKFDTVEQKLYISENLQSKTYEYLKNIIRKVEIEEPVTQVFNSQFEGYKNLEEVKLPNTVTYIGEKAFRECYNLQTINIPNKLNKLQWQTFFHCESLKTIEIPQGLKTIGSAAFSCCTSLENINIPETVTSIENTAFYDCHSLQSIYIPQNVTRIDNYTFYNCTTLESIQLPEGVTNIGDYAFYKCYNLKNVNIPDKVTNIGRYAFNYCINLRDLRIPSTVNSVGNPIAYWATIKNTVEVGTTEIELPDIIKRATTEGDILYCGTGISITSGKLNNNKTKLLINENASRVIIYISSGPLRGMRMIIEVSGLITYDSYGWTNDNITATLHLAEGEKIINNSGEPKYTFTKNGKFEFEYINLNNENKKITAKVDNIDKSGPQITVNTTDNNDGDIEKVMIEISDADSGLDSMLDILYGWGDSDSVKPQNMEWASIDEHESGDKIATFEVPISNLMGKKYLWIKPVFVWDLAGNEMDANSDIIKMFYLGPKVAGIEVAEPPKNTQYIEGQNFNEDGMKINAIYANGFTKEVTEYEIKDGENLKANQQNVTIEYEERNNRVTTTQEILVETKKVVAISVKELPNKIKYIQNKDELNLTGGSIEVEYNNNTKEEISMTDEQIVISGFDNNVLGIQKITVKYQDMVTQFDIEIEEDKTPGPENTNYDSAQLNVRKIKINRFTDSSKKAYAVIDIELNNILRALENDNMEYYYCLVSSNAEEDILNWVKIEQLQDAEDKLLFEINTQDIIKIEDIMKINDWSIYIKEIATKNNKTSESVTQLLKLKTENAESEELIDGEELKEPEQPDKKDDKDNTDDKADIPLEDEKEDTTTNIQEKSENDTDKNEATDLTVAKGQLPQTGKNVLIIFLIILVCSAGVILYFKYKDIEIK